MAHLRARPRKGERADRPRTWELFYDLPPGPGGKRRQETETFHGTKGQAEERLHARQAEISKAGPAYTPPSRRPLDEYLNTWIAEKAKKGDLAATTEAQYRSIVDGWIVPELGGLGLAEITPEHVEALLAKMQAGRTRQRRAQMARGILHAALNQAVKKRLLQVNPVDLVDVPAVPKSKAEAFTADEVAQILREAAYRPIGAVVQFAAYSGLRRGECAGLLWGAVDLDACVVIVRRSRVITTDGRIVDKEMPKTDSGYRSVALRSRAVEALQQARSDQVEAGRSVGAGDYVFRDPEGEPFRPDYISDAFRALRKRAGVRELPFHALRHTEVSQELAAGVDLHVVSKRIGHANISTTNDVYGHLLDEANKDAAVLADAFWRERSRPHEEGRPESD